MAVISVEVPDKIANKFLANRVVSSEDLYDELDGNWSTLVDFWKEWVSASEVLEYLQSK